MIPKRKKCIDIENTILISYYISYDIIKRKYILTIYLGDR